MAPSTSVPVEALVMLRRRLAALPAKHPDRQQLLLSTGTLYGVSRATLYRLLRGGGHPRHAHRADRGRPRVLSGAEVEGWCEIIAAMKVRTTNRKGRHLSTVRILELLEKHGVETPDGLQKLPPGKLTASTINRHMRRLGYDNERMTRPPPAVRFQAEQSNALWHFDMSPSELKQLAVPPWIDPDRNGAPTLMLFSVVDDRSGVAYQEYRCVYGEDAESALRFLFNAMSAKPDEANPFQGVPTTLYLDNGPVAKSGVFQRVMESLNIEAIIHMPAGSDGRRTTARAKGKVERPFRTVKDAHETLYHFHQPETEEEANRWLARYIATYARCALGSGFAPSPVNPNDARSASTAGSRWPASPMRSILTWRARPLSSGGASSIRSYSSNRARSASDPTPRSVARSPFIAIEHIARVVARFAPTRSESWRRSSSSRVRR